MAFLRPFVKSIILLLVLVVIVTTTSATTTHAVSKTGSVAPAKNVGAPTNTIPLTPKEKEFLDEHNKVRIHSGLPLLTWGRKAAAYANWYARNRSEDCALVHSTGPFGENIFWGEGRSWTPQMAVKDWVREHRFYDRRFNSCQTGQMCGHYTQIVWRDTERVGCAQVLCGAGDTYIVCSYDPPGNYQRKRPFDKHNPAMYNTSDRMTKMGWIPSGPN